MNTDPTRHHDPGAMAPLSGIDPAQLQRLLDLAGPASRDALLTRLVLDLEQVRDRLAGAILPADWPVLRAQTHILIAVAGAVGADRLRFQAEDLNHIAHEGRRGAALRLLPHVLQSIDALLAFVRRQGEGLAG
jgi:hypothetical protein